MKIVTKHKNSALKFWALAINVVPYELTPRDIERQFCVLAALLERYEKVVFASHCDW